MAGRPQVSYMQAVATGRVARDPERFKGRAPPKSRRAPPLGDPPYLFTMEQRAAWRDIVASWWWLDETDREVVAAFCRIKVMIEQQYPRIDPANWNVYIRLLSVCGGAPTTRGKMLQDRNLGADDEDTDDEL